MKSFPDRKVSCSCRDADSWPKDDGKAVVWYTLALVTVRRRENFSLLVEDIKYREESV